MLNEANSVLSESSVLSCFSSLLQPKDIKQIVMDVRHPYGTRLLKAHVFVVSSASARGS